MERTRDQILAKLAALIHDAGRMTTRDARYEPLHGEIDDLCLELELWE